MKFKRFMAATMAATMTFATLVPALADDPDYQKGVSFSSVAEVYSPKLTVSVPASVDVWVNPLGKTTGMTKAADYTAYSDELKVWNASVDADKDMGVPVVLTVEAKLKTAADVTTYYNKDIFTPSPSSTRKAIQLQLAESAAVTVAKAKNDSGSDVTPTFDSEKKLKAAEWVVPDGTFSSLTNVTPVTSYGSLLSVAIDAPTTTDTTTGKTFTTDPTKVVPKGASVAIVGKSNIGADWKENDVTVDFTYKLKAAGSEAKIPQSTTKVGTTATTDFNFVKASPADIVITISDIGETKVNGLVLHNNDTNNKDAYGDVVLEEGTDYTVKYAPNATTATQTDATITIPKENAILAAIGDADAFKNQKQDFLFALSYGTFIADTLKVTVAAS